MKRKLILTPSFSRDLRNWNKSHPEAELAIRKTLNQLAEDANHPSLRTHKLRGALKGSFSCSAGYDLRILFEFIQHEGEEAILLLGLGSHDQVY